MSSPIAPERKSSIFIKNFHFLSSDASTAEVPSMLSLREQIEKRMLSKYDFSREAFYRMKITQILNRRSIPYSRYKERLVEIDIKEFIKQEYTNKEEIHSKLKLIILILSFLIKEFPNYLSLSGIYQIMQVNMMKKQKLINENYHHLIEDYKHNTNSKNNKSNIFDSDFFDDSKSDEDSKYYDPIFFTNKMNKSDSIGSVENLVKYINNIEKGYNDIGNGLLKTPLLKGKKSKQRRVSSMFSIIKKMTSYDIKFDKIDISNFNQYIPNNRIKVARTCNNNIIKEDEKDNTSFDDEKVNAIKAIGLIQARIQKTKTNSYLSGMKGVRQNSSLSHLRRREESKDNSSNSSKFVKTSVFIEKMKRKSIPTEPTNGTEDKNEFNSTRDKLGNFFMNSPEKKSRQLKEICSISRKKECNLPSIFSTTMNLHTKNVKSLNTFNTINSFLTKFKISKEKPILSQANSPVINRKHKIKYIKSFNSPIELKSERKIALSGSKKKHKLKLLQSNYRTITNDNDFKIKKTFIIFGNNNCI